MNENHPAPAETFPVSLPLRIDWSETDIFGHVNNVSYFKYLQASRLHYWEAVGMLRYFESKKLAPILASSTCNFRLPLHYPGQMVVHCRLEFIKHTSLGFAHQILNEEGQLAAEGHDVMVFYDFGQNQKHPVPDDIRQAILTLEQTRPSQQA